jgi:hypothetical protein
MGNRFQRTQGIPSALNALSSMQYDVTAQVTNKGWTMYDLAEGMDMDDVFYVHSHGNASFIWSDWNDYWYEFDGVQPIHSAEAIYGSGGSGASFIDLLPYRVASNGSGLPPFNSTGSPPINVAFIDSCNAADTNSFSPILYPYGNWFTGAPSSFPEDQSLVGYTITFSTDQTSQCDEVFWTALQDGFTVVEARQQTYLVYFGDNRPNEADEFMPVWGDFYTRLKGVYTGDDRNQGGETWYRNI